MTIAPELLLLSIINLLAVGASWGSLNARVKAIETRLINNGFVTKDTLYAMKSAADREHDLINKRLDSLERGEVHVS